MLYFLHGNDTDSARAKAHGMIESMQKKKPDAEIFRLTSDNWSGASLDELAGSQGLFERKFIVFGSRLFENKEIKEAVLEKLQDIGRSENVFIFLEGAVDKPSLALIEKVAAKVQNFEKNQTKKEEFNMFALADALGERNRGRLWMLYTKAMREGAAAEEISGILFWQVKAIIQAARAEGPAAAGMSPFVFQKSKRYAKNFSGEEISGLASKIVSLYHDAHRGLVDFEVGLERFALSL